MKNIFVSPATKIVEALNTLQSSSTRCLIVTRKDRYFLGTLNDGDLRRGVLKGLSGKVAGIALWWFPYLCSP